MSLSIRTKYALVTMALIAVVLLLTTAAVGGKAYALGGTSGARADNQEYDPATNAWVARTPMPLGQYWAGAAAVGEARTSKTSPVIMIPASAFLFLFTAAPFPDRFRQSSVIHRGGPDIPAGGDKGHP